MEKEFTIAGTVQQKSRFLELITGEKFYVLNNDFFVVVYFETKTIGYVKNKLKVHFELPRDWYSAINYVNELKNETAEKQLTDVLHSLKNAESIENCIERFKKVNKHNSNLQEYIDCLQVDKRNLKKERDSFIEKNNSNICKAWELGKENEQLKKELHDKNEWIKIIAESQRNACNELEKDSIKHKELYKQINDLQLSNTGLVKENEKICAKNLTLELHCNQLNRDMSKINKHAVNLLEMKIEGLEFNLQLIVNERDNFKKENESLCKGMSKLQLEFHGVYASRELLGKENEDLNRRYKGLTVEYTKILSELNEINDLKKSFNSLKSETSQHTENQLRKAKKRIANLVKQVDKLSRTNFCLRTDVDFFKNKYENTL